QRLPEAVGPGAAVEHDERARAGAHLDARGVAAIAERARPRLGQRSTGAPESDLHARPCMTSRGTVTQRVREGKSDTDESPSTFCAIYGRERLTPMPSHRPTGGTMSKNAFVRGVVIVAIAVLWASPGMAQTPSGAAASAPSKFPATSFLTPTKATWESTRNL